MNASLNSAALHSALAADLAALPLIEKWVAFASVSRDSNLPLIEWTRAQLETQGLDCRLTYDDSGKKANL